MGEGWLGKLALAGIAATIAWFARRPAERAAVLLAVDKQVETALKGLGDQLLAAHARCDQLEAARRADRELCDRELADMRAEIAALMSGPVADYTTIRRLTP